MTKEDAKDLTLSVLVVVTALLVADVIWLHCQCSEQRREIDGEIAALGQKLERHLNPPPEPTVTERAKDAYDAAVDAVKRGYRSVKEKFTDETKGEKK